MSKITTVTVNDVPLDLNEVQYEIKLQTGASARWALPQPTTAQLMLWTTDRLPVQVGDFVEWVTEENAPGTSRFRGQVTNTTLVHDRPGRVQTVATLAGPLLRLGRCNMGYDTMPEQPSSERIVEIFNRAGVVCTVKAPEPDNTLVEFINNNQTCRSAFEAVMYSNPYDVWELDQPIGGNSVDLYSEIGRIEPFDFVEIPAANTIWEPTWYQDTGQVVNDVTVTYGPLNSGTAGQTESVRLVSNDSIAIYGPISTKVTTHLRDEDDAGYLATRLIDTYAQAKWKISGAEIDCITLDHDTHEEVVQNMRVGSRISLTQLPAPTPLQGGHFWVEGFTEYYAPDTHTMTIALTPVLTGPLFDVAQFDNADPAAYETAVLAY